MSLQAQSDSLQVLLNNAEFRNTLNEQRATVYLKNAGRITGVIKKMSADSIYIENAIFSNNNILLMGVMVNKPRTLRGLLIGGVVAGIIALPLALMASLSTIFITCPFYQECKDNSSEFLIGATLVGAGIGMLVGANRKTQIWYKRF